MIARLRPHGFISIAAMALLALCAVAATLLMQLARDDSIRTHDERADAQRRQLLIAGVRDVDARLNAREWPLSTGLIASPASAGESLTVHTVEAPSADRVDVTMSAGAMRQRATFVRGTSNDWTLQRATLIP